MSATPGAIVALAEACRDAGEFERELLALLERAIGFDVPSRIPFELSPREQDVLDYVCLGYTNAEIASACDTSPNTVRNQLAIVFRKIGATTRAEAVALAAGHLPRERAR
jgi:DNA-binding CsgD family transcriptional regulator